MTAIARRKQGRTKTLVAVVVVTLMSLTVAAAMMTFFVPPPFLRTVPRPTGLGYAMVIVGVTSLFVPLAQAAMVVAAGLLSWRTCQRGYFLGALVGCVVGWFASWVALMMLW